MHLLLPSDGVRPLATLAAGASATVRRVVGQHGDRLDRLQALGVTPGAAVVVLQTSPGIVFLCDQTELAIERAVAESILVVPAEESL
jgi:Fe2+ transport system protein FeoA